MTLGHQWCRVSLSDRRRPNVNAHAVHLVRYSSGFRVVLSIEICHGHSLGRNNRGSIGRNNRGRSPNSPISHSPQLSPHSPWITTFSRIKVLRRRFCQLNWMTFKTRENRSCFVRTAARRIRMQRAFAAIAERRSKRWLRPPPQ